MEDERNLCYEQTFDLIKAAIAVVLLFVKCIVVLS